MKTSPTDCFALLDDSEATPDRPTSRLYRGFVREHHCTDPAGLDAMWAPVDADLREGLHAVLLIDYEWGAKLLKAGHERLGNDDASALRVLMFRDLSRLSGAEVDDWLAGLEPGPVSAAGVMDLVPSVDESAFTAASPAAG